jgi:hypothetical protein
MYTALRWISHRTLGALAASLAAFACSTPGSATDLHPEGPPMVEQVRLSETVSVGVTQVVFGFGSHPDATAVDEHAVTAATAANNKLRIIMDELLRGNDLEEIACSTNVTDQNAGVVENKFARVPVGATPDDIARCSVAPDVLPVRCPGSNPLSVCICAIDAGCPGDPDKTHVFPKGESVGVLDKDLDGAADNTRFIEGAVGLRCGGMDIPINLDMSYWTPSGNQQRPAQGGFDALGPAIVLVPGPTDPPVAMFSLPTSTDCGLVFSPDVVDKDGNQVCAPPDGDIDAGCTPGDTSAVHFTVEPLTLLSSAQLNRQGLKSNIVFTANAAIDQTTVTPDNITVAQDDGTPVTAFMFLSPPPSANQFTLVWSVPSPLLPMTHYTITVGTGLTDAYHKSAPQPFQFAFTTGAM